jgi:TRAP-type C4-dicarboxylate transport system permease small subunit
MIVRKVFDYFYWFLILLAKIQFVAMCLITFVNVFCRYVLNRSIPWSEEVSLVLMIWFCFIGMALGVKLRLHISIEVFASILPKRLSKIILPKVIDLLVLIFGILMLIYGYKLIGYGMKSTLPATNLPTSVYYGAPVVSGLMIAYESFAHLLGLSKSEEGGVNNA